MAVKEYNAVEVNNIELQKKTLKRLTLVWPKWAYASNHDATAQTYIFPVSLDSEIGVLKAVRIHCSPQEVSNNRNAPAFDFAVRSSLNIKNGNPVGWHDPLRDATRNNCIGVESIYEASGDSGILNSSPDRYFTAGHQDGTTGVNAVIASWDDQLYLIVNRPATSPGGPIGQITGEIWIDPNMNIQ